MAACRCGDTAEYWLTRSVLSPRRFLEAAAAAPVKAAPARTWWPPARKAA